MAPSSTPTNVAMPTDTRPTLRDTCAAYTRRLNSSRPTLSVPRMVPLSRGEAFFRMLPVGPFRET